MPLFYNCFYSTGPENWKERTWMLRLLCQGLKTDIVNQTNDAIIHPLYLIFFSLQDYKLLKRRHVLDVVLGYFTSPLADDTCKRLILEVNHRFINFIAFTTFRFHNIFFSFLAITNLNKVTVRVVRFNCPPRPIDVVAKRCEYHSFSSSK